MGRRGILMAVLKGIFEKERTRDRKRLKMVNNIKKEGYERTKEWHVVGLIENAMAYRIFCLGGTYTRIYIRK